MQPETQRSTLADPILMELEQEAQTTRKLLNIIPEDKLGWRPHPKAKSLGELAVHIARLQGGVAELARTDQSEMPDFLRDPAAESRAQILELFEESLKKAKEIVAATDDDQALADWSLTRGDRAIMTMPRIAVWRSILLNHNYHHRGQLATYLRQLDVPLPSIYGPSADDNPFA